MVPKNARDFKEIGDFGDLWRELDDGYGILILGNYGNSKNFIGNSGQSKWVAEQMIIRSSARGLPAFIYRLGLLKNQINEKRIKSTIDQSIL